MIFLLLNKYSITEVDICGTITSPTLKFFKSSLDFKDLKFL